MTPHRSGCDTAAGMKHSGSGDKGGVTRSELATVARMVMVATGVGESDTKGVRGFCSGVARIDGLSGGGRNVGVGGGRE